MKVVGTKPMYRFFDFIKNRSGATAIEFAIVAGPFFAGLFGIIELSYKSILQSELDNKLYAVASDIGVNNFTAETSTEFMVNQFCPEIGTAFLKCSDVELGVETISDHFYTYRNQTMIGKWNLGCANDPIIVELSYPVANFMHPFAIGDIVERSGKQYYRSRAVIRREPLLSGSSTC